jgi:hypothetical protein
VSDETSPSTAADEAAEHNPEQQDLFTGKSPEDEEPGEARDPLAQLTQERDELKDQLLRVMAETENFKKRAQWAKLSESIWAPPTPAWPSWKAASPRSSPTRKAGAPPPPSWPFRQRRAAGGQIAKRQAITNPENTVFGVKRLIGASSNRPEVQNDMKILPYKSRRPPTATCASTSQGKQLQPGGNLLLYPGQSSRRPPRTTWARPVTDAVITVPAYFNDSQRQATKDAGKIAGLNVCASSTSPRPRPWPTAWTRKANEKIAVFDLGGGTFDISSSKSATGCSRSRPPTATPTWAARISTCASSTTWPTSSRKDRASICAGQDGPAAAQGSRRKGQDGAVHLHGDRHQPALYHRRCQRPQAPEHQAHPGQARGPGGRPAGQTGGPLPTGPEGRRPVRRRDQRGDPGGRHDPHAGQGPGDGQGDLRQGAPQGRQPRRGGGHGRRHPGRRAERAAMSRTCCCWTSPRCPWASKPWAA